jgi:hypothetical protein
MTTKQYILLAHLPKKGFTIQDFGEPTEWHIYTESEIPRMLAKKAYYEEIFNAVYIRECSDVLSERELGALTA